MPPTVILLNPPNKPGWRYVEAAEKVIPLGLLCVGTFLKKNGFTVKLIDAAVERDYLEKLKVSLGGGDIAFCGLSVMTAQVLPALDISEFIRKIRPDAKIVWGGIHPTLFPEQTAAHPLVDLAVVGEGEETAAEIARVLSSGQDIMSVRGIAAKTSSLTPSSGAGVILTPPRPLRNIEPDGCMDFDIIEIEKYILKDASAVGGAGLSGGPIRRTLPVIGGLGCSYRCSFCINAILGKRHRMRSAAKIIADIEYLMKRYGADYFYIIDEDFFRDKDRVGEFLGLIEKKNLRFYWQASARANYFGEHYIDEKLLCALKESGFFHTGFGAESGSERILKLIHKGITKRQVEYAARISRKCGVNFLFSFMCALPGETTDEMLDTIRFCYKLIRLNPDNYIVGPQVFRPYPGSPLYDEAVKSGLRVPSGLEEWGKVYNDIEGYFKLESLPWVKEPEKLRMYLFYLHFVFQKVKPFSLWKRIVFPVLKFVSDMRFRTGFFRFPVEYKIFRIILKKDI